MPRPCPKLVNMLQRKKTHQHFFPKTPTAVTCLSKINSRSNMHMNMVHWISLLAKKGHVTYFFRTKSEFYM